MSRYQARALLALFALICLAYVLLFAAGQQLGAVTP